MNQTIWLWQLENGEGIWQTLLKRKYLSHQTLSQATKKNGDSQFWSGLMEVNHIFQSCCDKIVGNGANTRLWEDCWMNISSLAMQFPKLYNLTSQRM